MKIKDPLYYLEIRAWKTDLPASGSGDYYDYDYDRAELEQDAEYKAEQFRSERKYKRVVIVNRETGRNLHVWTRRSKRGPWTKVR